MGKDSLPGYGSVASGNRLVRTRMLGGVGFLLPTNLIT